MSCKHDVAALATVDASRRAVSYDVCYMMCAAAVDVVPVALATVGVSRRAVSHDVYCCCTAAVDVVPGAEATSTR